MAGACAMLGGLPLKAEPARRRDHLALLADIHIHKNKAHVVHDLCPFEHFEIVREEILADPAEPARVIVAGDCAYGTGLVEDYATMIEGFLPFRERGLPVHLALGNHDHRKNILEAMAKYENKPAPKTVPPKATALIETPSANLFLLDSNVPPNQVIGFFGEAQLLWLAEELDKRPDKPALIFAHHHPMPVKKQPGLLLDTEEFKKVIRPRRQVKGYLFGHSHRWTYEKEDGIHYVNLPTTVWRFDKSQPYGWVLATLDETGMNLSLRCIDKKHPKHLEERRLAWR